MVILQVCVCVHTRVDKVVYLLLVHINILLCNVVCLCRSLYMRGDTRTKFHNLLSAISADPAMCIRITNVELTFVQDLSFF